MAKIGASTYTTSGGIELSGSIAGAQKITGDTTLNGATITAGDGPAIDIASGENVTITVSGANTVTSTGDSHAGIRVAEGATLTLNLTAGSTLAVQGGENGAGIGGNGGSSLNVTAETAGTINIKGAKGPKGEDAVARTIPTSFISTTNVGITSSVVYSSGFGGSVSDLTSVSDFSNYGFGGSGGAGGAGGTININDTANVISIGRIGGGVGGIGGIGSANGASGTDGAGVAISMDTDATVTAMSGGTEPVIDATNDTIGGGGNVIMLNYKESQVASTATEIRNASGVALTDAISHTPEVAYQSIAFTVPAAAETYTVFTGDKRQQRTKEETSTSTEFTVSASGLNTFDAVENSGPVVLYYANGGTGTMELALVSGNTFIVPACTFTAPDINLYAIWEDAPSTGGGGGSKPTKPEVEVDTDEGTVDVKPPVSTETDTNGTTTGKVTEKEMDKAIEAALEKKESITDDGKDAVASIVIEVTTNSKTEAVAANLIVKSVEDMVKNNIDTLVVESKQGTITLDQEVLKAISENGKSSDEVLLVIRQGVDTKGELTEAQSEIVGEDQVYELYIEVNGARVSDFKGCTAYSPSS